MVFFPVLILFVYFVQPYEPSNIIYLPTFVHPIKLLLKGKEQIKNCKSQATYCNVKHQECMINMKR